jgi:hypothetical protein
VKRIEVFEKGDKRAVVGVNEFDNVTITYYEFKRLVELDGWAFAEYIVTQDQVAESGRETLEKLND